MALIQGYPEQHDSTTAHQHDSTTAHRLTRTPTAEFGNILGCCDPNFARHARFDSGLAEPGPLVGHKPASPIKGKTG
jgi:hypothetical protein